MVFVVLRVKLAREDVAVVGEVFVIDPEAPVALVEEGRGSLIIAISSARARQNFAKNAPTARLVCHLLAVPSACTTKPTK